MEEDDGEMSCSNCDCPLPLGSGAHAACMHGYMTGCAQCGVAYEGGYSLASDAESGPPCQEFISELEEGLRAGNTEYREEYDAIRARWHAERVFTLTS